MNLYTLQPKKLIIKQLLKIIKMNILLFLAILFKYIKKIQDLLLLKINL